MTARAKRGRPLDPAVSQAALQATLELLDERGYAGLRVDDVASRAGIGLGGLYRRWATKSELVKAALVGAAAQQQVTETDDPHQDLVDGLLALNAALAGRGGRFLALLFSGTEPELATAIRVTKLIPLRAANRVRLRRVVGDGPGVDQRADAGVGLMLLHYLADGAPMTEQQIVEQVVPMLVGSDRKT